MLKKRDIDERAAHALGMKTAEVSAVTACFLRSLLHAIVDEEEVRLEGFGKFVLRVQQNNTVAALLKGNFKKGQQGSAMPIEATHKYRVWFKKAQAFREIIWDRFGKPSEGEETMSDEMEKYAVDEQSGDQEQLEKKAAQGCPEPGCNEKVQRHGGVLMCPKHGTEPWEGGR